MRSLAAAVIAALLIVVTPAMSASTETLRKRERRQSATIARYSGTVAFFAHHARLARTPAGRRALARARVWLRVTRREIAETRAEQRARRPVRSLASATSALWSDFLCIHRYEGAWNAATGNGYFGGLQMDYGFMSAYGADLLAAKGTADRWTPAEQITVAIRAYESGRGFWPWPNTARACGLL